MSRLKISMELLCRDKMLFSLKLFPASKLSSKRIFSEVSEA